MEPLESRRQRYAGFLKELRKICTFMEDEKQLLDTYGSDYSSHKPVCALAAVQPASVEQVVAIVKLCAAHRVPMTPRGAGTGLEGGAIPFAGGLVIDTKKLQRMDFDVDNAFVWVGAGVTKLQLLEAAEKHGFTFGPDPASNPSAGGMVSTSCSGMSTVKYGTARENILSLRVVTPHGDMVETRKVVRKSSSGLELTHLYCGSEGTLGVVCEVAFKLWPLLRHSAGGIARFDTLPDAVRSIVAIRRAGFPTTLMRCELISSDGIRASNEYLKQDLVPAPTILIAFADNDASGRRMLADFNMMRSIFLSVGRSKDVRFLERNEDMKNAWEARRACFLASFTQRGRGREFILTTDVCVPISKLDVVVSETEKEFAAHDIPCMLCAHIADGNFHCAIPYKTDEEWELAQRLECNMIQRAIAVGGTVSGEHGLGIDKVKHVLLEHGAAHIDIQERIKAALDPLNLMNPGVFYPRQQLLCPTAHL